MVREISMGPQGSSREREGVFRWIIDDCFDGDSGVVVMAVITLMMQWYWRWW